MAHGFSAVLAHYGGLDEIGVFVVPVVLAVLALRWVDKRARDREEGAPDGEVEHTEGQ